MSKILALSFFPAFTPPSNGGESRLFHFYNNLSKNHSIVLLSSGNIGTEIEIVEHANNFIEKRVPKDATFQSKYQDLAQYSSGADISGPAIMECGRIPGLMHNVFLKEYVTADIIIHESPFTVYYDLFRKFDDKVRIYNSYNCETVLYNQMHPDAKAQPIKQLIAEAERDLLESCDILHFCSEEDLTQFRRLSPNVSYEARYVPNGVTISTALSKPERAAKSDSVVFMGSAHPPNVAAARHIVEHIAPSVPEIVFNIIGDCLPPGQYPPNVIRWGFVDSSAKEELLFESFLAINPMLEGSGSNIKVLDFLAHGIPLLSTKFGLRGIQAEPGSDCLIADLERFPNEIRYWKQHHDELKGIGDNGRRLAETRHSWGSVAEGVSLYLSRFSKRKAVPTEYVLLLNDYDSFAGQGGGCVRTRGIVSALNKDYRAILLCFCHGDEICTYQPNSGVLVVSLPRSADHLDSLAKAASLSHISIADIISSQHCCQNELMVNIYNTLKLGSSAILAEHPYLAVLPIFHRDRFIYSSHNVEAELKTQSLEGHPLMREAAAYVQDLERQSLACAAVVIAVSQQDADLFTQSVQSCAPIVVVPNGAENPAEPTDSVLASVNEFFDDRRSCLFVGSNHLPNVQAAQYIVDQLAGAFPEVQFHIVGTVCNALHKTGAMNVHLWGSIDESTKSAVMRNCDLALNPMFSGGGSNIKVSDYLINGLPVLSTTFGTRGYESQIGHQVFATSLKDFPRTLQATLQSMARGSIDKDKLDLVNMRELFSMQSLADSIRDVVHSINRPKRRLLFVTYRYTNPTMGGAEAYLESLVQSLDQCGDFQIDVVCPKVSKMQHIGRFAEAYSFQQGTGSPTGLLNTRYKRFEISAERDDQPTRLREAWQAQPEFEKEAFLELLHNEAPSGLAWGWGDPEDGHQRWALKSCGLYLSQHCNVKLELASPRPAELKIMDAGGNTLLETSVKGRTSIEFSARGVVEFAIQTSFNPPSDPRPLGFLVDKIQLDNAVLDLSEEALYKRLASYDERAFEIFLNAARTCRGDISLTSMRGPFSDGLEDYIRETIDQYDLVLTHNNIFRPAVVAVAAAKTAGIPVVSIPHAHLEDDFYHFPDVTRSIIESDLALLCPRKTADFYRKHGAKVAYHAPGIDINETYSDSDSQAFFEVARVTRPFFLLLGRKAAAKRYQTVICAAEQVANGHDIELVMIGPDDDGVEVDSSLVNYLGLQPRDVVRGALRECVALVNMSSSESFGMVVLEAWMAGKPVILSSHCAAFQDIATHQTNALLVHDERDLEKAMITLLEDDALASRLGEAGRDNLQQYDWEKTGAEFVDHCFSLLSSKACAE